MPITATFLPVRSRSWRHWAEWKAGPANVSAPGSDGMTGFDSWPTAETTRSASYVVPPAVATVQVQPSSCSTQEVTAAPVTTRSVRPSRSAEARR